MNLPIKNCCTEVAQTFFVVCPVPIRQEAAKSDGLTHMTPEL
jgi:hypothetical protein